MGRPIKISKSNTIDIAIPSQSQVGNIGVIGGNSSASTLLVQANIEYATGLYAEGDSYIVRQKGEYKYLVANVANVARTGICYVKNYDGGNVTALQSGEMAIIATDAANANVTIAKIQSHTAIAFADQSANAGAKANIALGDVYFASFVAANATVQTGSAGGAENGPDGGGAPAGGLFPIIKLPSL